MVETAEEKNVRFQKLLQNSPLNSFKEIKEKLGNIDSSRLEMVLECFSVRRNDIKNILLQEQCAISGPVLQDFDWKVKWVMGSSKSALLREPLLNLDLYLSEGGSLKIKDTQRVVNLELDKDELNKLISALEKAQETLSNWHM
ncbi:hypothetical protein L9F63_012709 [Diploptera punctata]|uniref:COMM domain-containing protein n=1 Tax=Diploptera punctata TaxID=6984 RepID=A0AAD8EMF8_DIPPU|nr:hypothetical protein L9F63_012709 [Diploptera punctata]